MKQECLPKMGGGTEIILETNKAWLNVYENVVVLTMMEATVANCTIPEKYRPTHNIRSAGYGNYGGNWKPTMLRVGTDGEVAGAPPGTSDFSTNVYGQLVWII